MMLRYKTGKLPFNFIALGVILLAVSIWRIMVLDWSGIPFLVVSIVLLFIESGVVIDPESRRVRRYIGLFTVTKGEWEDVSSLINLQIIRSRESRTMNFISISRTETNDTYKLYIKLPNRNVELMSGKKEDIQSRAEEIASALKASVVNNAG